MRVTVFFTCWLVFWMAAGTAVGSIFGAPLAGVTNGFIFAVLATFFWPLMPKFIDDWMDDPYAPTW